MDQGEVIGTGTVKTFRFTVIDNTDVDLIFGGCRNCMISDNKISHTDDFSGSSFAALMIHAWPSTSGDFTGSTLGAWLAVLARMN